MAFNRDRNFQRGGFKKDFSDRGSRRPVEMHSTVCDKCGKNCEVPFRPTPGKPVFCSNCFDRNTDSNFSRSEMRPGRSKFEQRENFSSREDFETVCDECGKNCTVPFRPTEGKPVYCRDCFGKMKNSEGNSARSNERNAQTNDYSQQINELNSKLDRILKILTPEVISNEVVIQPEITEKISKPKKKTTKK